MMMWWDSIFENIKLMVLSFLLPCILLLLAPSRPSMHLSTPGKDKVDAAWPKHIDQFWEWRLHFLMSLERPLS